MKSRSVFRTGRSSDEQAARIAAPFPRRVPAADRARSASGRLRALRTLAVNLLFLSLGVGVVGLAGEAWLRRSAPFPANRRTTLLRLIRSTGGANASAATRGAAHASVEPTGSAPGVDTGTNGREATAAPGSAGRSTREPPARIRRAVAAGSVHRRLVRSSHTRRPGWRRQTPRSPPVSCSYSRSRRPPTLSLSAAGAGRRHRRTGSVGPARCRAFRIPKS